MNIIEDEKEKGKTIKIGKAFFETPHKWFTLLDTSEHADYIPNLLQGDCQADFAKGTYFIIKGIRSESINSYYK